MPRRVAAVGEILWDVFPDGPRFGGAPANFACTIAGLGGDSVGVAMVSAVGRDDLGDRAVTILDERLGHTDHVQRNDAATGRVDVVLDEAGVPDYVFAEDSAWDRIAWEASLSEVAAGSSAVCFGTLGQRDARSRETIQRFVESVAADALRILDVNLRSPYDDPAVVRSSLPLANVLKLNDDELEVFRHVFDVGGTEVESLQALAERFDLEVVALTRGGEGSVLLRGDEVDERPGVPTTVVDTVGAGDAFTAALVLGLLEGWPLDVIHGRANRAAAFVCGQSGATPPIPAGLLDD